MARAPGLSAPTLSPFGGSGAGFGAFSIVDPGREAYLTFLKVENAWQNGKTTDDAYLAAMRVYANALPEGSSTRLNTEQRITESTYRVERNVLVSQVEAGAKDASDLLAFDQGQIVGLDPNSETYRDRVNTYQNSQQQVFTEAEKVLVDQYRAGTLTTTQLQSWYRSQAPAYADNPSLGDAIAGRVTDLTSRVQDERDSAAITDYNAGHLSDAQFLNYAVAARGRYTTGTTQAKEWDQRIDSTRTAAGENGLLYRYGLSQRYAQLEQFIKSNTGSAGGGTRTSSSTRIVLGADNHFHTVTSTTSKAYAPTALQQAAHKNLLVQIADAKRQMTEIVGKLGAVPGGGGWVQSDAMIAYYAGRQSLLVRGSADWYAMQGKIDSLQERQYAEKVLSQQGIRITYPGVGAPAPSGGGGGSSPAPAARPSSSGGGTAVRQPAAPVRSDVTVDSFLKALGDESGNRYDIRGQNGSFGKYQIAPTAWPAWAAKYLGSASAPQSPANQETVAKAKVSELYKQYGGDWAQVATAWHSSDAGAASNLMGRLGIKPTPVAPAATTNQGRQGLTQIVGVGKPFGKSGTEHLVLKATSLPTNLDGDQFASFYRAYEKAFNANEESFVDNSSGHPVAYFIGSDPLGKIERMRQLDDLRIEYLTVRANQYKGTGGEEFHHNAVLAAVQDLAAHEFTILDSRAGTTDSKGVFHPSRGSGGFGYDRVNPVAAGVRVIEKTVAAMAFEAAAAKDAYARGDFASAYAHLQLERSYLGGSVTGSGPNKGQVTGSITIIGDFLNAAYTRIGELEQKYGVTPEDVLNKADAGTLTKDLERLRNAGAELNDTWLASGEELNAAIKDQVKTDDHGNVVLDKYGQVQLGDGWMRQVSEAGKVAIVPKPSTGFDPNTGESNAVPDGFVKVFIKVGSSVEDVYAKYAIQPVGWIRATDGGGNRPIMGKTVRVLINGKPQDLYEDPFHPGHWNSSAIAYNEPTGFKAIPASGGNTGFTFTAGNDGITYSMVLDTKTGTYSLLANKQPSLFDIGGAKVDEPVADMASVLALAGFTRDGSRNVAGGFVDIGTPSFGLTLDEQQQWEHKDDYRAPFRVPAKVQQMEARDAAAAAAAAHAEAFRGIENLAASRAADDADRAEQRAYRTSRALPPSPITSNGPSTLPAIKLPQISPTKIAAIERAPAVTPPRLPAPTTVSPTKIAAIEKATAPRLPAPAPLPTVNYVNTTKVANISKLL